MVGGDQGRIKVGYRVSIPSMGTNTPTTDPTSPIEERLSVLEAGLLEQEHRLYRVLLNFLRRQRWPAQDPRRNAAVVAFWTRLLMPTAGVVLLAGGGGIVAWLTLLEFRRQNNIVSEQLALSREQFSALNAQAAAQRRQGLVSRKAELIEILWSTKQEQSADGSSVEVTTHPSRLRNDAVREFIGLLEELNEVPLNLSGARLDGVSSLRGYNLSQADLSGAVLFGADLSLCNLQGASLDNAQGIVWLRQANLEGASLMDATLAMSNFDGANLAGAVLNGADLQQVTFAGATFGGADFGNADLRKADLRGAVLAGTETWDDVIVDTSTIPPGTATPEWWTGLLTEAAKRNVELTDD